MSKVVCVCTCLLFMLLVDLSSAFVVTSSNAVLNFSRLDLAPNLKKFIEHEEIRLKVIKGMKKHKDEVPLVEQRLEEFKSLEKDVSGNRTSEEDLVASYVGNHPTSLFVALRNFVFNWVHKFDNTTLYGTRLQEFIDQDNSSPLPQRLDLHRAATALSVIQEVYNLSVHELTSGRVNGHQGAPLSAADSLYIGKIILEDGLLDRATMWVKSAVDTVDLDNINKDTTFAFNISDALATLAKLAFSTEKDQRAALELFEKAHELDPENDALHSEYVKHRSGRNVTPLPGSTVTAIESWKQKYFDMCRNSTNVTSYHIHNKTSSRLRCRYKVSSAAPYLLYKEEILNMAPFVSVIYDFVSDSQAERVKNVSVSKLNEYILPGNSRGTMWQYRGSIFLDEADPVFANISWKSGDVTGLNVRQSRQSQEHLLGEPIHVIDYGVGGLTLPHADNKKNYQTSYMKIRNGNRYMSLLVQLSDVIVGGAIVFIEQNITIIPRKGMAVLMYNYMPSGEPEQSFFVSTCPLALGENVVLEKGIWSTIFETTNVCGRKPSSSHLMKEAVQASHKAAVQADKLRAWAGDESDQKETQDNEKEDDQTESDEDKPGKGEKEVVKHQEEDKEPLVEEKDGKTEEDTKKHEEEDKELLVEEKDGKTEKETKKHEEEDKEPLVDEKDGKTEEEMKKHEDEEKEGGSEKQTQDGDDEKQEKGDEDEPKESAKEGEEKSEEKEIEKGTENKEEKNDSEKLKESRKEEKSEKKTMEEESKEENSDLGNQKETPKEEAESLGTENKKEKDNNKGKSDSKDKDKVEDTEKTKEDQKTKAKDDSGDD